MVGTYLQVQWHADCTVPATMLSLFLACWYVAACSGQWILLWHTVDRDGYCCGMCKLPTQFCRLLICAVAETEGGNLAPLPGTAPAAAAAGGSGSSSRPAPLNAGGAADDEGSRPAKQQKQQLSVAEQVRRMHGQVPKTPGANVPLTRFYGDVQSTQEQLLFWRLYAAYTSTTGSTQWQRMATTS